MPSGKGTAGVTNDRDGVAIATSDVAAVSSAAELYLEAKKPAWQCLPSDRGTAVVTSDHDSVAIAAGDVAAAALAATELHLESKEPT